MPGFLQSSKWFPPSSFLGEKQVEIRGDLRKALTLVSSRKESELLWSGERESNPHNQLGRLELYH
jgi:hypothetical protein